MKNVELESTAIILTQRPLGPYMIVPMLKKTNSWTPSERLPTALPLVLGVLDQSHQILMPYTKTQIRIWNQEHRPLMESLLEKDSRERFCVIVHREFKQNESLDTGILAYVERIERSETQGYDLTLECLNRVQLADVHDSGTFEQCHITTMMERPELREDVTTHLDQLVQATLQLAQVAHEANVQLGSLLYELPHRRALLYRLASLLIQAPEERFEFVSEASLMNQINDVSIYIARALQVMGRRRDRNLIVGP